MRRTALHGVVCLTAAAVLLSAAGQAAAGYVDAVLADGPVAYYRLGESSGATAVNAGTTGAANDGTYVGGVGYGSPGALYDDGDSAVSFGAAYPDYMITNPFSSFPTTALTVETWLRSTGSGDGIVAYARSGGDNEVLIFDQNALRPHINQQSVSSGVDVNDGRWHHVVTTWQSAGGELKVYNDGALQYATTGLKSGYSLLGNGALVLAQEQDAVGGGFDPNQRFIGALDEVAIYDKVLSADDVASHYHAARSSVVAGNIEVDASHTWTVTESGPGTMSIVSGPNEGDAEVAVSGDRLLWRDGVMLATVRENGRGGTFGNVEVPRNEAYATTNLSVATSRAGSGGGAEKDINVAAAFFPFAGAWTAGHVDATGNLVAGHGVSQSMLTHVTGGAYDLKIPGVDSWTDGMLFVVGASNEDNVAGTFPLADGSGWRVNVQDCNADYSSEADDFSFVYMPYSATNLVGGLVDNDALGTVLESDGDFTLTRESLGTYRLSITGKSPQTGMLLLSVAEYGDSPTNPYPDDNMLLYEADGNDFLIYARDLQLLTNYEDTQFVFAYIDFEDPPFIPEPATVSLLGLGGLAALIRRRRRR